MYKAKRAGSNSLHFWCPGCDIAHGITYGKPQSWSWNGDVYLPTITPSVLVQGGIDNIRCHSYVTDGRIQFLIDSNHALAGRTVELPDWPFP